MDRTFPYPWTIDRSRLGYWVRDAKGVLLAYVPGPGKPSVANKRPLSPEEGKRIAIAISRLPRLLGAKARITIPVSRVTAQPPAGRCATGRTSRRRF